MSQQHDDDEGTVIRPGSAPSAAASRVFSPAPASQPDPSDGAEDSLSLRIGSRVAEFEVVQRIGEGGFSIVYLAKDHSLERTVALKEYLPSSLATRVGTTQVQPRSQRYRDTFEAGLKSFVNEAKLLAQFDHPSLVKVYRFWEANGTAYMVMPFYQGVTVKEAIRALPHPPDEAWLLALLAPLTEALSVIHAEHCYHRDIAPDNVILLAGSAKPLLLDFGAARRVIGDTTQGLTVILKAGYAPVEQYAEIPGMKQGPWTDVYALAAVVYWAVTGSTPPPSVGRMMSDSFVPLSRCAADRYSMRFLQAIDRALVVLPEQRTRTIDAFRQDLGLATDGSASPPPAPWNDSEATVIRPVGRASGPATVTQRESRTSSVAATAAQPARVATVAPAPDAVARHAEAAPQTTQASPRDTATRPEPGAAEAKAGSRRWAFVASAAVAVAAAGIWWAVQRTSVEPTRPARDAARDIAPHLEPSATQGAAPAPVAAPPEPAAPTAAQPTVPTAAQPTVPAAAPTSPAVDAEATKPPSEASAASSVEPVEEAPPTPAAKAAAPPRRAAAPPHEPAPDHSSQRPDAGKRERARTESANSAECARILQRLSLGESSPELLERLKALNCR